MASNKEYMREWRKKNAKKTRKYQQDYYYQNREIVLERARNKYHQNKCAETDK